MTETVCGDISCLTLVMPCFFSSLSGTVDVEPLALGFGLPREQLRTRVVHPVIRPPRPAHLPVRESAPLAVGGTNPMLPALPRTGRALLDTTPTLSPDAGKSPCTRAQTWVWEPVQINSSPSGPDWHTHWDSPPPHSVGAALSHGWFCVCPQSHRGRTSTSRFSDIS